MMAANRTAVPYGNNHRGSCVSPVDYSGRRKQTQHARQCNRPGFIVTNVQLFMYDKIYFNRYYAKMALLQKCKAIV